MNDGTPTGGQEVRSVDALEDFFAGSGVAFERHESLPGRMWEAVCRDFLG